MLYRKRFSKGRQGQVLDLGSLELSDVLDITISDLRRCVGPVLGQDTLRVPVLDLANQSDNTTSSVLQSN